MSIVKNELSGSGQNKYSQYVDANIIAISSMVGQYGQIFISNKESNGNLQVITQSRGKQILNITGGKQKIFLFQQINQEEHVVTAIHPEQHDFIQDGQMITMGIDQVVQAMQGLKIAEIKSGLQNDLIRTQDGKLFSYGKNNFGSLGLGGSVFQPSPKQIIKLDKKKIVSVSCGFYHSLALSNIGDLYSWGRGFEGQLGLKGIQTASSPQFVTHFYKYDSNKDVRILKKNPIHYIACGASHSMAIDVNGTLYCWGQARFGQTGNGKKTKEPTPVSIRLQINGQQRKAQKVEGGLGHTLCLTSSGQLFSWGLNIKGQLGLNDLPEGKKSSTSQSLQYIKASYYPVYLQKSRTNQTLPKFKQIACGFCRSFAIDVEGNAWCWGGGALGFKDKYSERCPIMLTENTENRKFSKVFANEDSLVLFSSLQLQFFKPSLATSKGSTQLTFFGFGFTNTGSQSARFKIHSQVMAEVDVEYDEKTSTFYCKTPQFEKINKNIQFPVQCQIQLSLDRIKYYSYTKKLLIYSSKLSMQSCQPKIGSAHGAGNISIYMPIDNLTLSYIESLTVGFKCNTSTLKSSLTEQNHQSKFIDWICSQGTYKESNIICRLPNVPQFDNQNPFYLIDVSLNGQQFTQIPQTFRFYFVTQTSITPNQGLQQGQYQITINGKGLFDSQSKQLKLSIDFKFKDIQYQCERNVQIKWIKDNKNFMFKMPSLTWLIGDHQITPQLLQEAIKNAVSIKLYLSKTDSIDCGSFKYTIPPPPVQVQQDKKDAKKDTKKGAKK